MAATVVLVCLVMAVPLFFRPGKVADLTNGDWRQLYFHHKAARDAMLEQGEPCFWCPHINGGFPLAAHPHDPSFSPLFPIVLIAGEVLGFRINVFLIFIAGVAGMALLTGKCMGFNRWGVWFATLIYASAGWFPARLYGGNYWETFYYLFPLIVFCVASANKDRRYLFGAALLLYLLLAEANFVFPVTLLFLGFIWLCGKAMLGGEGADPERVVTVKNLGLAVIFACLVGAVKFHLLSGLLAINPREVDYRVFKPAADIARSSNPFYGIAAYWDNFIRVRPIAEAARMVGGLDSGILGPEYLGCGGLALAMACFSPLVSFRRFFAVAALLGLSIALSFSLYLPFDLFAPISRLPVFNSIYNTLKYFNYYTLFFICLGAGGACQRVFSRCRGQGLRIVLAILLLASVLYPLNAHRLIIPLTFFHDPPALKAETAFFQVDSGPIYFNLMENKGIIAWHSSIQIPSLTIPAKVYDDNSKTWIPVKDYQGEAWMEQGAGHARIIAMAHNRIQVQALATAPGILVVNQNFDPGWSCEQGEVVEANGLIGVPIAKPGLANISLRYRPQGIWVALGVATASLILLIWHCFFWDFRRNSKHSAITGL
ncbi:MAG: hypothetical protein JEZ02_10945 [Desulfatibacillum sp.]|nr:hypothetical protein [Desulfatibacillum sp.]